MFFRNFNLWRIRRARKPQKNHHHIQIPTRLHAVSLKQKFKNVAPAKDIFKT